MSQKKYESLLRDFCSVAGIAEIDDFLATGHLRSDGFDLAVLNDPETDTDAIFVYVDLQQPWAGHERAASYEAMLKANYFISHPLDGFLCLQPDTGHVVQASRLSLSAIGSGEELADALSRCVDQAERWQDKHKAEQSPPAAPVSSGPQHGAFERYTWL